MKLRKERFESVCTLIVAVCLENPRTVALEAREDIAKNVVKLSKIAASLGYRYQIEAASGNHANAYADRTKVLGHKARELGRQIGLTVETAGPNLDGRALICTIGTTTVDLR